MPTEAMRLRRRLGARDRLFIAILVAAALIGTIAAVVAARGGGDSAAAGRAGCISITRASWMGSATLSYCGADAVAYCSKTRIGQFAAGHPESLERCRAAGIPPPAR